MIKLVLILLFLTNCKSAGKHPASTTKGGGAPVGLLRGYQGVNDRVRKRMIPPGEAQESFDLGGLYLNSPSMPQAPSQVAILMGSFTPAGGSKSFKNGDPNTVNMLLWEITMTALAKDIALTCDHAPTKIALNAKMAGTIQSVCEHWPNALSGSELHDIWSTVMAYDAPMAIETDWKNLVTSNTSPIMAMNGKQAVEALMRTVLINPWFLIEVEGIQAQLN